jgi:CRISPR-associated protein Cas5h
MKALAFDIYGAHAQFKTWYTTTSRTTFPLPPRTVLAGIVGAILGVEREDLPERFEVSRGVLLGVRSLKGVQARILVVKGLRGPAVLTAVGQKKSRRIEIDWSSDDNPPRIPTEVIQDPEYRVYVHLGNESEQEKLKRAVESSSPHFRPFLGTSEMVACLRSEILELDLQPDGRGTGVLAGLVPKEWAALSIQELRRNKRRIADVVAPRAITPDWAYLHGEYYMDASGTGIPGYLADAHPHVIDAGLTVPLF